MVVERLIARWTAKDTTGVSRLFSEDLRWWTAPVPGAPWPTVVRNRREVEAFFLAFQSVLELTGVTTRGLVVHRPEAVLMGRLHARVVASHLPVSCEFALSISLRGGLIHEFRVYADTFVLARALA